MKNKKTWDDIPSVEDLAVDWDYEPENVLGKRLYVRLERKDLFSLLGKKSIPVKLVSTDKEINGIVSDISQAGVALFAKNSFAVGERVKVGFFLERKKIISRAVVRNVVVVEEAYRIGLEFVNLGEESLEFIRSLVYSNAHIF